MARFNWHETGKKDTTAKKSEENEDNAHDGEQNVFTISTF
jgi:hypothetical protein